jgi:hypothetical protein
MRLTFCEWSRVNSSGGLAMRENKDLVNGVASDIMTRVKID